MVHWKLTLDIPILEITYENLTTNQEAVSRAMVEFCGLEWNDACMNFHSTRRLINTPSHQQVRQPLHTRSVGRWRKYEDNLQLLFGALNQTIPPPVCDNAGDIQV